MQNIGRPKKEGLDKTIKFNVTSEAAESLDTVTKMTGKSKSDILRELIPIVSSKGYEELIPTTSLEILQQYSDQCWNLLHTPQCIFEVENFSDKMPAFITTFGDPVVYVKYPTYIIQIFDGKNPQASTSQPDIEELLKDVNSRSSVYATKADYVIIGNEIREMDFSFVNEVMCLGISLDKNLECKNSIVNILNAHGYHTSVYPAYCIRGDQIELLEDCKYFRILQK